MPAGRFVAGAFSVHALTTGHYEVLLTSTLLTRNLFMVASICVSLLVAMGSYEVLAGHIRATLLAAFAAMAGPLSVAGGLGLLLAFGSQWALGRMDTLDIGASAIVAASSGAIAGVVRYRRLTIGLVLFLLGGLLVHHQLADWEHLLIFPWGYLVGRVFKRGRIRAGLANRPHLFLHGVVAAALVVTSIAASAAVLPASPVYTAANGQVLSPPAVLDTTYPSPALHSRRNVIVLLPAGYENGHRRYPVVVFLHGDPGSPQALLQLAQLQNDQIAAGVAPFIGVLPDGNGPALQRSWYVNLPSQKIGTSVAVDLRRWVTTTFRTNASYSYAGLSSGGFAAAYLPLLDNKPIHAVCGLSGFYNGSIVPLRGNRPAQLQVSAITHIAREPALTFLAYGTTDSITRPQTLRYAAALRSAGKHVIVKPYSGGHAWSVWRPAFQQCLRLIVPAH